MIPKQRSKSKSKGKSQILKKMMSHMWETKHSKAFMKNSHGSRCQRESSHMCQMKKKCHMNSMKNFSLTLFWHKVVQNCSQTDHGSSTSTLHGVVTVQGYLQFGINSMNYIRKTWILGKLTAQVEAATGFARTLKFQAIPHFSTSQLQIRMIQNRSVTGTIRVQGRWRPWKLWLYKEGTSTGSSAHSQSKLVHKRSGTKCMAVNLAQWFDNDGHIVIQTELRFLLDRASEFRNNSFHAIKILNNIK